MKRVTLTIILMVVVISPKTRAQIYYRVPTVNTPYLNLQLPYSQNKNVQMAQTLGVIGVGAYQANVADRHGREAIRLAREDRRLRHEEGLAQQNACREAERQAMFESATRLRAGQEAKQNTAKLEKLRQENEILRQEVLRLRLELQRQMIQQQLDQQKKE